MTVDGNDFLALMCHFKSHQMNGLVERLFANQSDFDAKLLELLHKMHSFAIAANLS